MIRRLHLKLQVEAALAEPELALRVQAEWAAIRAT